MTDGPSTSVLERLLYYSKEIFKMEIRKFSLTLKHLVYENVLHLPNSGIKNNLEYNTSKFIKH